MCVYRERETAYCPLPIHFCLEGLSLRISTEFMDPPEDFDDSIDASDNIFESLNVKVVIDKFSFGHIENGTLNFSDGLNSTGFGIENPNAVASCGCGTSFTV